jgi:hypothetical protein
MDVLNILVLHRLGDPDQASAFLKHHIFSLSLAKASHNILYHDVHLPLPKWVQDLNFHAIILDVTFLCIRWTSEDRFAIQKLAYEFVKYSDAVKIALPQDEYDCNELLDNWMCEWRVDAVVSVISNHWNILYPKYHLQGEILLGYTGYVDESLIDKPRIAFAKRSIGIGYRARKLPPYFGRIGENKWTIGRDVANCSIRSGIHTDIVLGQDGTLIGDAWLDFINNSKFTLGANSGSSLLDPVGDIQRRVRSYLLENPNAEFGEVEKACFPGLDGKYAFTAISPRILEAGMLESCQILVEGDYSNILKAWEHYIPIKPDASDFDVVTKAMADLGMVNELIANCRRAILDMPALRYQSHAQDITNLIYKHLGKRKVVSDTLLISAAITRYKYEVQPLYQRQWLKAKFRRALVHAVDNYPNLSRVVRKSHSKWRNIMVPNRIQKN